jgi:hypothetical protein
MPPSRCPRSVTPSTLQTRTARGSVSGRNTVIAAVIITPGKGSALASMMWTDTPPRRPHSSERETTDRRPATVP